MWQLEDRVVVVTGAAGDIGRATVRLLAEAGAKLVLADLDGPGAIRLAASVHGDRAVGVAYDATDPAAGAALVATAVERFGAIDVLVPAAGIYPTAPLAEIDDVAWRHCLAVNLDGAFQLCRAAAPVLRAPASIVLIASIAAHHGSPDHAHYAAAKGGLAALGRSLAKELAPDVRVNTISPGPIEGTMVRPLMAARGDRVLAATPLGRLGRPEEVANCIAFLASPLSSFVTGATLHVNGGLYLSS
ncbi:MAG: SDR family NAD(P)-dependent oxidoreductase [Pseudomonadota bacterium]